MADSASMNSNTTQPDLRALLLALDAANANADSANLRAAADPTHDAKRRAAETAQEEAHAARMALLARLNTGPYLTLEDARQRPNTIAIGADIGEVNDPTALAIVECAQRASERYQPLRSGTEPRDARAVGWVGTGYVEFECETVYIVRELGRIPLGTGYPEIERRIADAVWSPYLGQRERLILLDWTGVGRAVGQHVQDQIQARGQDRSAPYRIRAITFTAGREYDRNSGSMGKAYMVSRLSALLQWDRVILPEGHRDAEAMREELIEYEVRVSRDGHDTYGNPERTGKHDDLATALGLAVLEDPNEYAHVGRAIRFSSGGFG